MRDESRIRVLIAEDESHLGTLLENYLTGRGFQVTTRRDGRAALEAMKAEAYDVALLDIVMPELDGLEVLRQVREEPSPPEVIIITGNGTIETAISAMKLGAYDYISKPYRMAEIDLLVRRAAEKVPPRPQLQVFVPDRIHNQIISLRVPRVSIDAGSNCSQAFN
jgi:DNA-binding response OmpR family regulator